LDYLRGIGFAVAAGSGARGTEVKTETEPSLAVGVAKGSSPTLRVLTFNVLFPNSETSGVWWIYKYFDAADADTSTKTGRVDATSWQHRVALLQRLVSRIDADIVCFQEPWNSRGVSKFEGLSPEEAVQATFKSDFAFMLELGYEGELLQKGSIRPATFWKTASRAVEAEEGVGAIYPSRCQSQRLHVHRKLSSAHKVNRSLVTLFEVSTSGTNVSSDTVQHVAVVNCHLTAAPVPKERLATVEDGLKAAGKLCSEAALPAPGTTPQNKKGKGLGPATVAAPPVSVILCGDFNGSGGVVDTFLRTGEVGPDDTIGLGKRKAHTFPRFTDCGGDRGPTLVVPNIDTKMLRPQEDREALPDGMVAKAQQFESALKSATGRYDGNCEPKPKQPGFDAEVLRAVNERALTPAMLRQTRLCFDRIMETPSGLPASRSDEISGRQVNWWLRQINRQVGRGSEFRHARELQFAKLAGGEAEAMGGDGDLLPGLTFQEFATVWRLELEEGKYWAVEHDLGRLCGSGMRQPGDLSYQGRFDYIYVSSASPGGLRLVSADPVAFFPEAVGGTEGKLKSLVELGLASGGIDSFVLPNAWHPSDHLPVVADFVI